jgi:hypothetical protein
VAHDQPSGRLTVSGSAAGVLAACDDIARIIAHVRDRPPPPGSLAAQRQDAAAAQQRSPGREPQRSSLGDGGSPQHQQPPRAHASQPAPLTAAEAAAEAAGVPSTLIIDARGCLAAIIGARGATIKKIQADSGARVDKLQETLQLKVTGLPSQCAAAIAAIDDVVVWAVRFVPIACRLVVPMGVWWAIVRALTRGGVCVGAQTEKRNAGARGGRS